MHNSAADVTEDLHTKGFETCLEALQPNMPIQSWYGLHAELDKSEKAHQINDI